MINKLIIIFTLILNFTITNGQVNCGFENKVNDLGIGIIECPESLTLYKDSLCQDTLVKGKLDEINLNSYNICGKFSKPDYGILHFVCIDTSSVFYTVLVNSNDIAFIKKQDKYLFKSWYDYLMSVYGLGRNHTAIGDFKKQPVRKDILNSSDTLTIPKGVELFCPIEIKGDWIKIQYNCKEIEGQACNERKLHCEVPLIGWIRWRKENEFLIDIYLLP